jgi:hypothetical protein
VSYTHATSPLSMLPFCMYICWPRTGTCTTTKNQFKGPFRVELFRKYHERQHLSIWRQYQSTSKQDKSTFFDDYTAYVNTLFAKFQPTQTPFTFDIDAPIVDTIIGDKFFHPDDHIIKQLELNPVLKDKVSMSLFSSGHRACPRI